MTTLLLLLAAAPAAELAPAPAVVPDDRQIAAWVADLSHQDYDRQRAAVQGLVRAGPRAKAAVPDLIKLLTSKNDRHANAILVLGAIGPDAKAAIPALLAECQPSYFAGFQVDQLASAIAWIDGPKPEVTRALLLSSSKCIPCTLAASSYLTEYATEVVPHVVALCADKDAGVRLKAAQVLGGLAEFGFESPAKAITLLARAGVGAGGVPAALQALLADPDATVRLAAAHAITRVLSEDVAVKTIPVVIATLCAAKPQDHLNRAVAAEIFRPIAGPAAAALTPLFDSDNATERGFAIDTLRSLPVLAQLQAVLKTAKSARAREAAATCLGSRYGEEAVIPPLKEALSDPEFVVRFAAACGLVQLSRWGNETPSAVPVLIEGLKAADEVRRLAAGRNLLEVGAAAKAAVPDLKTLLADPKPEVALEAALALAAISPADAADAVPVLTRGLGTGDVPATRAAKALANLGAVAVAAVPELTKRFEATNLQLRIAAAGAAARIDPAQADRATGVLLRLLGGYKNKGHVVREEVAKALVAIGPAAKAAGPMLLEFLKDKGAYHLDIALAAIAVDPGNAAPALEWVRKCLANKGEEDAYSVADQLQTLGPAGAALLPDMLTLLKSKTPYFRENAAEALGAIGPGAKEALPLLKEMAEKDPRPNIRKTAAEAVRKIEAK